ncbi:unnamed protein product [Rotaria sp. Silwood1]|nr:unnamed protein product [Rotaria sp. Silwood1]
MIYRKFSIWILLLLIIFILHGKSEQQQRHQSVFHNREKRHYSEKCFDNYSAVAPYQIPEGQSPFIYVPNVTMLSPYSTCSWVPYVSPQDPKQDCPAESQNVLQTFIPLTLDLSFLFNAIKAERIIKANVEDSDSSIIKTQSLLSLHCSLIYLDCYNDTEIKIIEDVMENYQWSSFQLNFTDMGCNVDNHQAYLNTRASQSSSLILGNIVHDLETAITARGVRIKQSKGGNFHMTLATVKYQYPSDCIVNQLKQKFISSPNYFGSKKVCCFWTKKSDGWIIKRHFAQDCSIFEKLIC